MSADPPPRAAVRDLAEARAALEARSDVDLLAALRAGDRTALGVLYDRHAGLVYGLARAILQSPPEAEDLTQEIFAGLCDDDGYDPGRGPLRGYLVAMTRSRAIDRHRSRERRLRLLRRWHAAAPPVVAHPTPLQHVSTRECTQRVRGAMAQLSAREREVLELAYYKGLTQAEIAAHLGAPLGSVKSWARRGLLSLRDSLQDMTG